MIKFLDKVVVLKLGADLNEVKFVQFEQEKMRASLIPPKIGIEEVENEISLKGYRLLDERKLKAFIQQHEVLARELLVFGKGRDTLGVELCILRVPKRNHRLIQIKPPHTFLAGPQSTFAVELDPMAAKFDPMTR